MNSCYYKPLPLHFQGFKGSWQGKPSPFTPKSAIEGLISMIAELSLQLPLAVAEPVGVQLL